MQGYVRHLVAVLVIADVLGLKEVEKGAPIPSGARQSRGLLRSVKSDGSVAGMSNEAQDEDAPQDCEYADWERWSECSASCGGGTRHRTREVEKEGDNGGKECEDSEQRQSEDCNSEKCPIDCVISDWQDWGKCTPDCSGKRFRPRTIIQSAKYGGEACGETREEESCDGVCTDCEYQDWSAWDDCPVTCGGGTQKRRREVAVEPTNGGKPCVGSPSESKSCSTEACPVDCVLRDWTAWTACEPYCEGNMTRQRLLKTAPAHGGEACGERRETRACKNFCVHCRWEDWSAWGACTAQCGGGKTNRSRDQSFVTAGESLLEQVEKKIYGFEFKGKKACDLGHQVKEQSYALAVAQEKCQADANCVGLSDAGCDALEVYLCTTGFAQQENESSCLYNKKEVGGGAPCKGTSFEAKGCNEAPCKLDCAYTDWSDWTPCEPYCLGKQRRSRKVRAQPENGGRACVEEDLEEENGCMNECADCLWADWGEWSRCSASCGGGTQSHRRSVAVERKGEGRACTGPGQEEQDCNAERCPIDCVLTDWTPWSRCEPYCSGSKERSRRMVLAASDGGEPCGPMKQEKACGNFCMDCLVSDWSLWSSCSKECGGGKSKRSRRETYVQRGTSLLELTAWGYEKQMNLRCDAASLGKDAGRSPKEAEALCSADEECAGLYDEGCHGLLIVCKKGFKLERERGSCAYSKKEIGEGEPCKGNLSQVTACNTQSCPVDCQYTSWTDWSRCDPFCDGQQTRSRKIKRRSSEDGVPCGTLEQSQACSNTCVDCQWSHWDTWSVCSQSCEGGQQNRSRRVAVARSGLGANCSGAAAEQRVCGMGGCPVDCEYEDWSQWSTCTPFCAGSHERSRAIKRPAALGGVACGHLSQKEACRNECKDCVWSNWTEWSSCSASCGGGSQERRRAVEVPAEGGQCLGSAAESRSCNAQECPKDCVQSLWSDWSSCEPYCDGVQKRTRTVLVQAAGGKACGAPLELRECNNSCVDCRWSDWMAWSDCDASCDGGARSRLRYVAQPKVGEAAECRGARKESQDCNTMNCPVDCQLSDWSKWSRCEPYCLGHQNRSRTLVTPATFGGAACGELSQSQRCSNFCMDCQLSDWTAWSACSKSCSGGLTLRRRDEVYVQRQAAQEPFSFLELGAANVARRALRATAVGYQKSLNVRCDERHQRSGVGAPHEAEKLCSADPSCGGLYDRGCTNWVTICNGNFSLEPEEGSCVYSKQEIGGGEACQGDISQAEPCNEQLCPVDCVMGAWSEWSSCSPFCNGTQSKTRSIRTPAFQGEPCGETKEERPCENFCIDCSWSDWSEWKPCSSSCGGGTARRDRLVESVKQGGGAECQGTASESKPCGVEECPVDCELSSWGSWSSCEPFCDGTQERRREVLRAPQNGSKSCMAMVEGNVSGVTRERRPCSNWCRDCGWLDWTPYSACSRSCGGGLKSRFRDQVFTVRSTGGEQSAQVAYGYELKMNLQCDASSLRPSVMPLAAARKLCDQDAQCGGVYDQGCDGSVQLCELGFSLDVEPGACIRSKLEVGEGKECLALENKESEACGTAACPIGCEYSDWTAWSRCQPSCNGTQTRNRAILSGDGPCLDTSESQDCSEQCVSCRLGDWSLWSKCSISCGGGTRSRRRAVEGAECGNATEVEQCGEVACPEDCELSDWTPWSSCRPYCKGQQERSRKMLKAPRLGGASCGDLAEQRECGNICMDCVLSGWDDWTICSASCGGGKRERLRKETYTRRNESTLSLLQTASLSKGNGYEKKLGVRCDKAHQRRVQASAPLEAEKLCSADDSCSGIYDQGCENLWSICDAGFVLEEEPGSCSYIKKDIGEGEACEGNLAQAEDCGDELCPVDCGYSEWTVWSPCEPMCGGITSRSRNITRQPQDGGEPCGKVAEVKNCSNVCVDCQLDQWSAWTDCSASCRGGSRERRRHVRVPQEGAGRPCGNTTEVESCMDEMACPVDCQLSDWAPWTTCSPYCSGHQQRNRSIIALPYAGGAACKAVAEEVACSNACVDCEVTEWNAWSSCSTSCGGGSQRRSREILVHAQGEGVLRCPEKLEQIKEDMCAPLDCPVDCQWTDWTPWNGCSVSCGEGTQDRSRQEALSAEFGGAACNGSSREWKACDLELCPKDCIWDDWNDWGDCSRTCDGGKSFRNRSIASPKQGEGADCGGGFEEHRPCRSEACPRDCMVYDWQEWSDCSASCGPGAQRKRIRDAESEIQGGKPCNVSFEDYEACGMAGCPRSCIWGDWGGWSNCTKSCGKGIAFRERVQLVVAAFGGGCPGSAVQTDYCNDLPCPEDCVWDDWMDWSNCTALCRQSGSKTRTRRRLGPFYGGEDCLGADSVSKACVASDCDCAWEDWTPWSPCSRSCGNGTRTRSRSVATEAYGLGRNCSGEPAEEELCVGPCAVDCAFRAWGDWGACEAQECGPAQRRRSRGVACGEDFEACEVADTPVVPCNVTVEMPFKKAMDVKAAAKEAAIDAAARGGSAEAQAEAAADAVVARGGNASAAA